MEEFFSIFQKFFRPLRQRPQRGGEQPPDSAGQPGRPQQRRQRQTAEGEEIGPAPQRHRGHVEDAHPPVVPGQGEQEQGRRSPQPEQQIQRKGQADRPPGAPQGAHGVVDQPQQRTQQERLPEYGGLARDVHVHAQRSSRERKPPLATFSSS